LDRQVGAGLGESLRAQIDVQALVERTGEASVHAAAQQLALRVALPQARLSFSADIQLNVLNSSYDRGYI
jgi:hypothetical protein